jgi:SWIM zinc finger
MGNQNIPLPTGLCQEEIRTMNARKERGVQLAQRGHIVKQAEGWQVLSQTGNGHYLVKLDNTPSCTCPDFEMRGQKC